jgi:hypothetical protein
MLEGIDMNVVNAAMKVLIVSAGVLKKPPLPNAMLPAFLAAQRTRHGCSPIVSPSLGKIALDATPASGIVSIGAG